MRLLLLCCKAVKILLLLGIFRLSPFTFLFIIVTQLNFRPHSYCSTVALHLQNLGLMSGVQGVPGSLQIHHKPDQDKLHPEDEISINATSLRNSSVCRKRILQLSRVCSVLLSRRNIWVMSTHDVRVNVFHLVTWLVEFVGLVNVHL